MQQEQFLDVVDESVAHERFDAACARLSVRSELVPIAEARGRRTLDDIRSAVDVPGFDRSNVDGFAVRAPETYGADESEPVWLHLDDLVIHAGHAAPDGYRLLPGHAVGIATGGAVPRGADAVVMIEHTLAPGERVVLIQKPVTPGRHVGWAGTDIGRGEIVLRAGAVLSSRETGLLAAVGVAEVRCVAAPRVAVLSTGDEIRAPGDELRVGDVYDSNARILADAVVEEGGRAIEAGICGDDAEALRERVRELITDSDIVLLSGGTSKGVGDLNSRVVAELAAEIPGSPGILVHGVALKPGKPICLAVVGRTPVVILPGFPTSCVFTFHEFVAPLIRRLAGRAAEDPTEVEATAPLRIPSVIGRTQYTLVDLVEGPSGLSAYPLGGGSGSVSAFSRADGFVRIPHDTEYLAEGSRVVVRRIGTAGRTSDLVAIGSHCVGLDRLLGFVEHQGYRTKSIAVGSLGGLRALDRGEGDVAGLHLLDPATGTYNLPFLNDELVVLGGYGRRQGLVYRKDDTRFKDVVDPVDALRLAADARMVNRNAGSGTRVLIDMVLRNAGLDAPDGYHAQAKSHHAVAAAVAQGRADWGVTLDVLAEANGLAFLPLCDERYDVVARADRFTRPAVAALRETLASEDGRAALRDLGFVVS